MESKKKRNRGKKEEEAMKQRAAGESSSSAAASFTTPSVPGMPDEVQEVIMTLSQQREWLGSVTKSMHAIVWHQLVFISSIIQPNLVLYL